MHAKSATLPVAVIALLGAAGLGMSQGTCSGFDAHLSGADEVPAVQTNAQAEALFLYVQPATPPTTTAPTDAVSPGVPPAGPLKPPLVEELGYKLMISKTAAVAATGDDGEVTAAEIHCAPAGQSGPLAVSLFQATGAGVLTPTRLHGALTDASIVQPNDCGYTTLQDLVTAMQAGNTYVDVHTNAFPDGEIRGQIREVAPQH